jgi:hypothetical protein
LSANVTLADQASRRRNRASAPARMAIYRWKSFTACVDHALKTGRVLPDRAWLAGFSVGMPIPRRGRSQIRQRVSLKAPIYGG